MTCKNQWFQGTCSVCLFQGHGTILGVEFCFGICLLEEHAADNDSGEYL
jgi:hypothetical protein